MPRLWRESLAPMMITSSPSFCALANNSFHLASKEGSGAGLGFSCGFPTSADQALPWPARPSAKTTAVIISHRLRFAMTHSWTEIICFEVINFVILNRRHYWLTRYATSPTPKRCAHPVGVSATLCCLLPQDRGALHRSQQSLGRRPQPGIRFVLR